MIPTFSFASIPHIIFGTGKLIELYDIIPKFGNNVLFVIGGNSLKQSGKWDEITSNLENKSINFDYTSVSGEPSPTVIDENVVKFRNENLDLIIGIGGGSVIDAGKAISAMLTKDDSITNYLEGVGTKIHNGKKIPYIAIPTTSGTGSEATKNAVISEIGSEGFKKSLRHNNLIPNIAIIDPELMISCPPSVSAACGMDAFTQLLEAYVSSKATPITDALAFSGMKYVGENILQVCADEAFNVEARACMAYGSLISGIVLANAGLGIIHGLASPIGGYFNIPHGVVCGTLLAEATRENIDVLQKKGLEGDIGLIKYAKIGALLMGKDCVEEIKILEYCRELVEILEKWTRVLQIDTLGKYGIEERHISKIAEIVGLKNNPVNLSKATIQNIILNRL
jgi:alcohol dehydrogenase class IV